jgi:hypothetical protein
MSDPLETGEKTSRKAFRACGLRSRAAYPRTSLAETHLARHLALADSPFAR